jgi:hypothetical protein
VRHTGSNRLLVLSAGENGSSSKTATPPQFLIVNPSTAEVSSHDDLATVFDGLAQSADGKFAVLYHDPDSKVATGSGLFNPNEMVVVDFSANVAGTPTVMPKSIRSLGNVPTSIRFSPVYSRRSEHRLAVVFSQSYLTLFDLLNLSQPEISLPLCLTGSSCNYKVEDVVFDPSSFKLYVRVAGARDIYQVSLTESETPDTTLKYTLSASLSMLAVDPSASATDMVLYGADKDARLAVLAPGSKRLVIIDPSTSNSTSVSLAIPASKLVPFLTPSIAAGTKPKNQALLLDVQGSSNSALFADFGSTDAAAGTSVKQYSISGGVSQVVPVSAYSDATPGAPNVAILLFNNRSSGSDTVMSVVNLDTRSFFDFSSTMALTSSYLEVHQATATGRLWSLISPDDGTSSPDSGIYYRDVPSSGSSAPTVWLDQTIKSITPLSDAGGVRYLVLGHVDPTGYGNLTLLDARTPERATARTAYGFLFTDYLGRNQP